MPTDGPIHHGQVLERVSRSVVLARDTAGRTWRLHVADTKRPTELLTPGAPVCFTSTADVGRSTDGAVTRVWDGTWVALEATRAADTVAEALAAGWHPRGWPVLELVEPQVVDAGHRPDLLLREVSGERWLVEVIALTDAVAGVATLSAARCERRVAHLAALGRTVRSGGRAGVVFLVQREDVERVALARASSPSWLAAVRHARAVGVHLAAAATTVTPTDTALARELPIDDPVIRPPVTDELLLAYQRTDLLIEDRTGRSVRVRPTPPGARGHRPWRRLAGQAERLTIVTSANPGSRPASRAANDAADRALAQVLTDHGHRPRRADGIAHDGQWRERGFVVPDRAITWIRTHLGPFGQLAVYELTHDALTIRWLDDPSRPTVRLGWQVVANH